MNYKHHLEACILTAVFISIFCLQTFHTPASITLIGLHIIIPAFSITAFWLGVIPHAVILTCDLDSESSIVTKMLGPFNPFHPFARFGHREALHHWFWGPFNLVGIWLMPALYFGVDVSGWAVLGAVSMLWCHMAVDVSYSGVKRVLPKWIWKRIEKVI